MDKIKVILLVSVVMLFQACSTKRLSESQIVEKSIIDCKARDVSIIQIPSRGFVADSLSIMSIKTAGNDGGFYNDFSKFIKNGFKNIAIYCPNTKKTEAILSNTLSLYKNNELNNISICVIGMENSENLSNEANRTGSNIKFVP